MDSNHSANVSSLSFRKSKSVTALVTLVAFIATTIWTPGVSFGAASMPSIAETRLPYQVALDSSLKLALPQNLGKVEDIRTGQGASIIHIQTAHGHYEAQQKIREILHYLDENHGVQTVFVEGSAYELDPDILNFFPGNPKLTQSVADELTKHAIVKGPELYLLDKLQKNANRFSAGSPRTPLPRALGIEDIGTYRANGESFVTVLNQKEKSSRFLRNMDEGISRLSSHYLNDNLRKFLRSEDSFEKKLMPFDAWLSCLGEESERSLKMDLRNAALQIQWPMMVRFFKLKKLHQQFNGKAFEKERDEFLKALRRFIPQDTHRTAHAASHEPAALRSGGLVSSVESLLRNDSMSRQLPDPETSLLFEDMVRLLPKDFNYAAFPNVRYFIGTLLLSSELKADRLMGEVSKLTDMIAEKLAKTETEKKIVGMLRDYRLLQKLFSLELTADDYEKIGRRTTEDEGSLSPSGIARRFESAILRPQSGIRKIKNVQFDHLAELDALYDSAMEFYSGVKARDLAMIEKVEKRLRETGVRKAAVITGGFHSQPFKDYFASRNYTYALISPLISGVDEEGHRAYIAHILRTRARTSQPGAQQNEGRKRVPGHESPAPVLKSTYESVFLSDPKVFSAPEGTSYGIDPQKLALMVYRAAQTVVKHDLKATQDLAVRLKKAAGIATSSVRSEARKTETAGQTGQASDAVPVDTSRRWDTVQDDIWRLQEQEFQLIGERNRLRTRHYGLTPEALADAPRRLPEIEKTLESIRSSLRSLYQERKRILEAIREEQGVTASLRSEARVEGAATGRGVFPRLTGVFGAAAGIIAVIAGHVLRVVRNARLDPEKLYPLATGAVRKKIEAAMHEDPVYSGFVVEHVSWERWGREFLESLEILLSQGSPSILDERIRLVFDRRGPIVLANYQAARDHVRMDNGAGVTIANAHKDAPRVRVNLDIFAAKPRAEARATQSRHIPAGWPGLAREKFQDVALVKESGRYFLKKFVGEERIASLGTLSLYLKEYTAIWTLEVRTGEQSIFEITLGDDKSVAGKIAAHEAVLNLLGDLGDVDEWRGSVFEDLQKLWVVERIRAIHATLTAPNPWGRFPDHETSVAGHYPMLSGPLGILYTALQSSGNGSASPRSETRGETVKTSYDADGEWLEALLRRAQSDLDVIGNEIRRLERDPTKLRNPRSNESRRLEILKKQEAEAQDRVTRYKKQLDDYKSRSEARMHEFVFSVPAIAHAVGAAGVTIDPTSLLANAAASVRLDMGDALVGFVTLAGFGILVLVFRHFRGAYFRAHFPAYFWVYFWADFWVNVRRFIRGNDLDGLVHYLMHSSHLAAPGILRAIEQLKELIPSEALEKISLYERKESEQFLVYMCSVSEHWTRRG